MIPIHNTKAKILLTGIFFSTLLFSACKSGETPSASVQAPTPAPRAEPTVSDLEKTIGKLLVQLQEDPDDEGAQGALTALGKSAIPALKKASAGAGEEARASIVRILADIPGDAAFDAILAMLDDNAADVRLAVTEALGQRVNGRAVPALLKRYEKEDDNQVRYEILTSLGPIADPSTVPFLVKESSHEDRYVRMWAADALCVMGAGEAGAVAARLLGDKDLHVRKRILAACSSTFSRPDATAGLIHIALTADDFEESVSARRNLQQMLAAGNRQLREQIRSAATTALGGAKAVQAALLLADINDASGLDKLRANVGHGDPFVRHHIAFELGRLGGPSAVEPLVTLLNDPAEIVAATAYDALLNFKDRGNEDAGKAVASYKGKTFGTRLKDLPTTKQ